MMIQALQRFFLSTVRRQLVIGVVLIVGSMMSLLVWDLTRRQEAVAREAQIEQAQAIARSVSISSAAWLASRDLKGLEEIVQGLASYPDLQYAMVLDNRGQVLAHSDPALRGQFVGDLPKTANLAMLQPGNGLLDVVNPVLLNGRAIGWVRVGLTGAALRESLTRATRGGIYYGLAALAISIVFVLFASRYLTRRLYAISRVASSIQTGHTTLRAVVDGDDEAAQLARQFNGMLDTLAQRDLALKSSEAFKTVILDSVAAEVVVVDHAGVIVAVNAHWQQFAMENSPLPGQVAARTGVGTNYLAVCGPEAEGAMQARAGIQGVLDGRLQRFSHEYPCHSPAQKRWFNMVVMPLEVNGDQGAAITHTDISAPQQAEPYEQFQSRILELMAGDVQLNDLLLATVSGVEQLHPQMLCSILLLDEAGLHLSQSFAPSLHDFYNAAIEGVAIGMGQGSCGTAAFTGKRVIVEDIATHPYWAAFKELAERAGLRACWSEPIVSPKGEVLGTFAIYHREPHGPSAQDIAMIEQSAHLASIAIEHKRTQVALQASEETFRTLFETAPHGVVYQKPDGRVISANPAALRILGLTLDQMLGRTSMDPRWKAVFEDGRVMPGDQHPAMLAIKTGQPVKDVMMGVSVPGREDVWILVSAMPLFKDGKLSQVYAIFEDVTERHHMQLQVRQLAYVDPLTQLPNRRLLLDRLSQVLNQRSATFGALMFLDLDNFKPLNDQCGHEAGDFLLMEVAHRLQGCVREADTVARFGGDEFVVMLPDLSTDEAESAIHAQAIAEKIRARLAEPYRVEVAKNGKVSLVEHACTASVGLTMFVHNDDSLDALLQRADSAMYRAKEGGRNTVRFLTGHKL
jgi:diguanylate cyclase (GGDEF)-like protein/PAS domain S-box-containing protein